MAPPTGARPGWSRRAQYGLFFGFLATIAGLLIGLAQMADADTLAVDSIKDAAVGLSGRAAQA